MEDKYLNHNRFRVGLQEFVKADPQLFALSQLKYQYDFYWWHELSVEEPGVYILTGGRQVGKSTSCKQLIKFALEEKLLSPEAIFYLPCDEIYEAKDLSRIIRLFLDTQESENFLLVIDEVTYVKDWDRVIKAIADEGYFQRGVCILTGSDTVMLKEAAVRFPGRRGAAAKTDFHLYPLSFKEYVDLVSTSKSVDAKILKSHFEEYLQCGGYLRAINDIGKTGEVSQSTFLTYEQWIRGDFLKRGKSEDYLLAVLKALMMVGVSQISYSTLTRNIGLLSKETCIDYCRLLERMDILINLQAYDQNKKQGFPRKDRKFHFVDPFIYNTLSNWLTREGYMSSKINEANLVEACVASHCHRVGKTYYFKGQGEIDVILLQDKIVKAIEVKWSEQVRPADLKMLQHFKNSLVLTKLPVSGKINGVATHPVYEFLYELGIV